MSTQWLVTTATERITLDPQRRAEIAFTVTNPHPTHADRAVVEVAAGDGADAAWFLVADPQRLVRGGTSASYTMSVSVPPAAAAGDYSVQARVYSADSAPEESSVLSSRVLVQVPGLPSPPAKRRPWWVLAVAALVAIVIGVVTWLAIGSRSGSTVTVPDLSRLSEARARAAVTGAGLAVGTVRHRIDPAPAGVVTQSLPAGSQVASGSTVDMTITVKLSAPILTPITGPFPAGSTPTVAWTQPEDVVTRWLVNVDHEACFSFSFTPSAVSCTSLPAAALTVSQTRTQLTTGFLYRPGGSFGVFNSGNARVQVFALDDFGNRGPGSALAPFVVGP